MKFSVKFAILTLSLLVLSGCSEENEALENISETILSESSISETTVQETISESEETTETQTSDEKSEEQKRLEQLITEAAKKEKSASNGRETIQCPLFGDFDGDGIKELVAIYGDKSEALFEDLCGGDVWFASGEKAEVLQPFTAPMT